MGDKQQSLWRWQSEHVIVINLTTSKMNAIFCYRQCPAQTYLFGIQQEALSEWDHKDMGCM